MMNDGLAVHPVVPVAVSAVAVLKTLPEEEVWLAKQKAPICGKPLLTGLYVPSGR